MNEVEFNSIDKVHIGMDVEQSACSSPRLREEARWNSKLKLLILNTVFLIIGDISGPILMRVYFLRGGHRLWLSTWLETGGWPIMLIPLFFSYCARRRQHEHDSSSNVKVSTFLITPRLAVAALLVGVITGAHDYTYSAGISHLPVSTSSLLMSTHLVFTAIFAFIIVRQKLSQYSINAVVLLTVGSILLGLHASGDRPPGTSNSLYYLGFFMTLGSAVLLGLLLPLVELIYNKAKQKVTYTLVMEVQILMTIAATAFSTVGMLANGDFQAIHGEAKHFELGIGKYYVLLVMTALVWQLYFIGAVGVIFCASSLFSGILMALLLPVQQMTGVMLFKERFGSEKAVALALAMWGFASYLFGEYKEKKKKEEQLGSSSATSEPNINNA